MKLLLLILINIIVSILIIYGGHHLWSYIKDKYSTKKTKDLVNTQIQKYKKMMKEMQDNGTKPEVFLDDVEKKNLDEKLMNFMDNMDDIEVFSEARSGIEKPRSSIDVTQLRWVKSAEDSYKHNKKIDIEIS